MWPNPQETADLVTFAEEIFNGKFHFLRSFRFVWLIYLLYLSGHNIWHWFLCFMVNAITSSSTVLYSMNVFLIPWVPFIPPSENWNKALKTEILTQ